LKKIEQVETEIEAVQKARDDCDIEINRLAKIHRGVDAGFKREYEATKDLEEDYVITKNALEVGQERLTRSVVDVLLGWKARQETK